MGTTKREIPDSMLFKLAFGRCMPLEGKHPKTHINKDDILLEAHSVCTLLGSNSQLERGKRLRFVVDRDVRTLASFLVMSTL
jgi:hypothetical protein